MSGVFDPEYLRYAANCSKKIEPIQWVNLLWGFDKLDPYRVWATLTVGGVDHVVLVKSLKIGHRASDWLIYPGIGLSLRRTEMISRGSDA